MSMGIPLHVSYVVAHCQVGFCRRDEIRLTANKRMVLMARVSVSV